MKKALFLAENPNKNERLEIERLANHWLAEANKRREQGKDDSAAMKKAQRYLDKLNKIDNL